MCQFIVGLLCVSHICVSSLWVCLVFHIYVSVHCGSALCFTYMCQFIVGLLCVSHICVSSLRSALCFTYMCQFIVGLLCVSHKYVSPFLFSFVYDMNV